VLDNGANSLTINVGPTTATAMSSNIIYASSIVSEMSIRLLEYNEITKIVY